jgi:hypothetical protein
MQAGFGFFLAGEFGQTQGFHRDDRKHAGHQVQDQASKKGEKQSRCEGGNLGFGV